MNYWTSPGTKQTSRDFILTEDYPVIGSVMIQESGEIVQVKSLAHAEVLVDCGAKVAKLRPSASKTVKDLIKKSFRPNVDLDTAFAHFKTLTR